MLLSGEPLVYTVVFFSASNKAKLISWERESGVRSDVKTALNLRLIMFVAREKLALDIQIRCD